MTDIYNLGSSLQKLLSTLKLNRERVPLETLKSVYRVPYEELKAQIRGASRNLSFWSPAATF